MTKGVISKGSKPIEPAFQVFRNNLLVERSMWAIVVELYGEPTGIIIALASETIEIVAYML